MRLQARECTIVQRSRMSWVKRVGGLRAAYMGREAATAEALVSMDAAISSQTIHVGF